MKQIRKRITYANVMSSLAVFLVLGGGAAVAAGLGKNSVGTGQIKRNAVKVGKLAPEAVRAGKLAKNAVPTNRLRNNAVSNEKIADGAVTEGKIGDGAVTTNKLGDNAVTEGKIANDAITTGKIANDAVTGDKVKESTLGEVPSAANAQTLDGKSASDIAMWAFVASNGTLFRSSGGVASTNVTTGTYNVSFPQNVNACAYTATNAANDNVDPVPQEIAVAKLTGVNNAVRVRTANSEGTATNDQFMLIVTC